MKRGIKTEQGQRDWCTECARFRGGQGGPHTLQSWHGSQDLKVLRGWPWRELGDECPGQREDRCRVPKPGLCLARLRNSSDACVAEENLAKDRAAGYEDRNHLALD